MHQLKAAWVIVMKGVWAQYIYRDESMRIFRDGMIGRICKDEGMHSLSFFSIFLPAMQLETISAARELWIVEDVV